MREIKFRAWDIKRKKMSEPFNLFMLKNGYFIDKEGTKEASTFYLSDCEILQYIGFKDRARKEIYPGSILQLKRRKKIMANPGYYEVKWDRWLNSYKGFNKNYSEYAIKSPYENADNIVAEAFSGLLVVGNVYENPELMKTEIATHKKGD